MSGSQPPGGADPSMEDILASIRRILNEDDVAPIGPPPRPSVEARPAAAGPDVFALDESMMVQDPPALAAPGPARAEPPRPEPPPPEPARAESARDPAPPRAEPPPLERLPVPEAVRQEPRVSLHPEPSELSMPEPPGPSLSAPPDPVVPAWPTGLVAPEAAAAAVSSVGSLRRTLEAGRASLAVRAGGPTLEDMVREELRPVLKAWLDANLAPMVERLVRLEIERLVSRADP